MANMINLTINGKNVSVEKGTTIIEAAKRIGIDIPNLCYEKSLTAFAGCRMCVVEIEGSRKLEEEIFWIYCFQIIQVIV